MVSGRLIKQYKKLGIEEDRIEGLIESNWLGNKLQKLREGQGWSLAELSRRTGVTQTPLKNAESGKAVPTRETLARIARALGIKTDDIVREETENI